MDACVAGTVSMSTVDWPGKISLVVFFAGCDYQCPYCYNSQYIRFKDELLRNIDDIKKEIKENTEFIDGVVLSGGEPTLQRQVVWSLARYVKNRKLLLGLETNGSQPDVIKRLIEEKMLNFIAVDLKAPLRVEVYEKVTRSKTWFKTTEEVIKNVRETFAILKENEQKIEIEVRTTIVPSLIYRKEDILAIAEEIKDLKCRWKLQQFRPDLGTILDKRLENVNAPNREFLEELMKTAVKQYPQMNVKIKAAD